MAGKRSKSSERWLRRQKKDYFARQARSQGQVSRAHFKLAEINDKYKLLRSNSKVLELGAAPGGWTNYIEDQLSNQGGLIVVDPLPVTSGAETKVICGLAGEEETDAEIAAAVSSFSRLDLVLSDMAPNMSGVRAVDQARSMELADVCLTAAEQWLKPGGSMALKGFQGEGLDEWVRARRQQFDKVAMTKPRSSRAESREVFIVCQGYKQMQEQTDRLV